MVQYKSGSFLSMPLINQQLVLKIPLNAAVITLPSSYFLFLFFNQGGVRDKSSKFLRETVLQPVIPISYVIKAKYSYAMWEEVVYFKVIMDVTHYLKCKRSYTEGSKFVS